MGKHSMTSPLNPPSNLVGVTPGAPMVAVPGFVMCRNCGCQLDTVLRPWVHLANHAAACNPTLVEIHQGVES